MMLHDLHDVTACLYILSNVFTYLGSSAQKVSNSFYHSVSLLSFLYFLFTFNTVYAALHHNVM